jgi:hypothetical protein
MRRREHNRADQIISATELDRTRYRCPLRLGPAAHGDGLRRIKASDVAWCATKLELAAHGARSLAIVHKTGTQAHVTHAANLGRLRVLRAGSTVKSPFIAKSRPSRSSLPTTQNKGARSTSWRRTTDRIAA